MSTQIDMIGIFVDDLHKIVAFYKDVLGFAIDWDGNGPYAEFKHNGIRSSMYERAMLPGLLGEDSDVSRWPERHFRAGPRFPCPGGRG